MNYKLILFLFLLLPFSVQLFGQCDPSESTIDITLRTDNYGHETSWDITDIDGNILHLVPFGTYGNLTVYDTTICVPNSLCMTLTVSDSQNDGIFPPGYFLAMLDGDTLLYEYTSFTDFANVTFNCPPGSSCGTAEPIGPGVYTTTFDDNFYEFIPPANGIYNVTTCNHGNTCDTKIWVYGNCNNILVEESNVGTLAYNDNANCELQADLNLFLGADDPIYIRIGDNMDQCTNSNITWELTYVGPIEGCTNPLSCNFNALATVDDGSCLNQNDPDCPEGPDLVLDQGAFETSIYLDTYYSSANSNNDNCLVEEQCLNGYGFRDIIRFTTTIHNIGESDYYIGQIEEDNPLFTDDNCHGHWHYDGYAEYLLFDTSGQRIPIGFKNGFCVIDLDCEPGISQQYTCENMGITSGCSDTYPASLECQWLDITDIPDGEYTMVARTNWQNDPDYYGNTETNIINNWAQVCINLYRDTSIHMELIPDCTVYTDCSGTPYGDAQYDCTGSCGGPIVMGDLDGDGTQSMLDAQQYTTDILGNDITPTSCNDLNADGLITVYEAALLSTCNLYGVGHDHPATGVHDHCLFPDGAVNIFDSTQIHIESINYEDEYFDIYVTSPTADIVAYQFDISGATIQSVENLVATDQYPIIPQANIADGMVIGISFQDSVISRSQFPQPLVRIHYMAIDSDSLICIEGVQDIINQNYEQTITAYEGCVQFDPPFTSISNQIPQIKITVQPNPFSSSSLLRFDNPTNIAHRLELTDMSGKTVRTVDNIIGNEFIIERENLPQGVYLFRLTGDEKIAAGKLVIH